MGEQAGDALAENLALRERLGALGAAHQQLLARASQLQMLLGSYAQIQAHIDGRRTREEADLPGLQARLVEAVAEERLLRQECEQLRAEVREAQLQVEGARKELAESVEGERLLDAEAEQLLQGALRGLALQSEAIGLQTRNAEVLSALSLVLAKAASPPNA